MIGAVLARVLPALLVGACASAQPCPGTTLAQIEADYAEAVLEQCKGSSSLDACPAVPELKARRERAEQRAGCR